MKIGEQIRAYRQEIDLTQNQLAARIGVSESTVRMWELGKNEPDLDTINTLCDIFMCTPNDLLKGEDGSKKPRPILPELEEPTSNDGLRFAAKLGIDPEDATPELQERLGRIAREMIDMAKKQGK